MKFFWGNFLVNLHRVSMWLFNHNVMVTIALLFFALLIAYLGYPNIQSPSIYENMPRAVGAVLNAFVDPGDSLKNVWLYLSQALAFLAFSVVILSGLFRDSLSQKLYKYISKKNHSLVVGLGENNRFFLDREYEKGSSGQIIIIEVDKNNAHIDAYKEKGFGVFIGSFEDYKINFSTLENIFISAGDDRINIDIVGEIKNQLDNSSLTKASFGCKKTVFVHLSKQSYKAVFHESLLAPKDNQLPLEFRTYSYEDSAARSLFMQDTVLGDCVDDLIDTDEEFSIVVIGNGILAERVIYHLIMMASLPNNNKLNLYLYCENSQQFIDKLRAVFFNFDSKISAIQLHGRDVCFNRTESQDQELWVKGLKNLTQIYICHDEDSLNLEAAINFYEYIYLKYRQEAFYKSQELSRVKINFAMYHNLALAEVINKNNSEFKQFYVFGDAKHIFNRKFLVDEPHESVAKLIHHGYGEKLANENNRISKQNLDNKWLDVTKFSDRESNRSQALHMHTKLKALKVNIDYERKQYSFPRSNSKQDSYRNYVLSNSKNNPAFGIGIKQTDILKEIELLADQVCASYEGCDVDSEVISRIFDLFTANQSSLSKLIVAEHERWNRFHVLNGWLGIDEASLKNKGLKLHNCIKPLNEFKDPKLQMTILYDLYALLYLNIYLNHLDFKQVESILEV